jgi:ferredoxin
MMTAPAVFDIDETVGKATVLMTEPGEDLYELVEKSARGCPANAIALESR